MLIQFLPVRGIILEDSQLSACIYAIHSVIFAAPFDGDRMRIRSDDAAFSTTTSFKGIVLHLGILVFLRRFTNLF